MRNKFTFFLVLLLAFVVQAQAQEKTVTGNVTDSSGLPLPGVNVTVKGTATGTQTDFDGNYSITTAVGRVLVYSYIGMKTEERTVGGANFINITLQEDTETLEEVVVVGYGVQKKKEVTGSISQIKGGEIQGLVTPSFDAQLAGRASGVQITTNNGIVGEAPRIRIRGISSINGSNYPLVVVDGVPIYTGDTGGYASTNSLADINPADIESFEILKDGASTAIYGSRAANGVILITTKRGKKGSTSVEYNSVIGFASPIDTFDLLGTSDFITIANEKRTNRGQAPWAIGDDFDTDWQDAVLQKGALQMDHTLSIGGGTDKTKYYLSLGYAEQEGVAKSNSMTRYTFRTNIEHDVNKWLTVGGNVALTRTELKGLNTGTGSLSGNIFNAIRQLPNTPIYNSEHPTGYNLSDDNSVVGQWDNTDPVGDNISNIVYVLDHNKFESKVNRTLLTAFASADIIKGLNYRLQVSADNPIVTGFLYWDPIHGDGRGSNGRLQNNTNDRLRWNWQNILNYNTTIAESHNIALTAVSEYQKSKDQNFFGVGTNLLSEFYNKNLVSDSYEVQESGGGIIENGIISYIGRATYNYKQRYFLQASIRRDGLSRLSPEKRWNNFTGYSAGWDVAQEPFMESLNSTISQFKIRGSYSEVGNTEIAGGSYAYLNLTTASPYATNNGIAFSQYGNANLLWETSKKLDLGADISLFNNKVSVTLDYFSNDIDGLILSQPVPPSLGIPNNEQVRNIGELSNKGFEIAVNYNAINVKDFTWNVSANATFQKNEVTSLPNGADINNGSNLIIRQGESLNSIYGYRYWGVNPANGNPVYYKADGSLVQGNLPTSNYRVFDPANPSDISQTATLSSATDRVILGNTLPKYFGSIINNFKYKNFDLSFMFRFSGGNKIFNATRRELLTQNLNNNGTEILGRWQSPENPGDGWTPRLWASSNTFTNLTGLATSRFVEDGDFISLDNVTLGYSLPSSILEKVGINGFRVYVQAQNLLFITDYKGLNPEMESAGVDLNGTPRSQILSMGLNVKL